MVVYNILTIGLNLFMIVKAHKKNYDMKTLLIASMGVGNILQSSTGYTLQIFIAEKVFHKQSNWMLCEATSAIICFFSFSMINHITALTVERLLRFLNPNLSNKISEKKHIIIIMIYAVSTFWAAAPLVGWTEYAKFIALPNCQVKKSDGFSKFYMGSVVILEFLTPVAIMVVSWGQLRSHFKTSIRTIMKYQLSIVLARKAQVKKFDKMTIQMAALFFITWFPYAMSMILYSALDIKPSFTILLTVALIAKACALINPLIYAYYYCSKYFTFQQIFENNLVLKNWFQANKQQREQEKQKT